MINFAKEYCGDDQNYVEIAGAVYGTNFSISPPEGCTAKEFFLAVLQAYRIVGYCTDVTVTLHGNEKFGVPDVNVGWSENAGLFVEELP